MRKEHNMKQDIFRKKSLERIQSPEQIDDYVRVVTPGLWLVLAAITLLLIAGIMWAVTTRIEVTETQQNGTVTTQEIAPISVVIDEGL